VAHVPALRLLVVGGRLMPNKAKVSDAYGVTVEVEGEAGHLELLAAASASSTAEG